MCNIKNVKKNHNYRIVKEYSYKDGVKLIESNYRRSHRLQSLVKLGNICVNCGLEGTKFMIGVDRGSGRHLDLYSDDDTMMTIDHIFPKSKGGKNRMDNYQLMCKPCNETKADTVEPPKLDSYEEFNESLQIEKQMEKEISNVINKISSNYSDIIDDCYVDLTDSYIPNYKQPSGIIEDPIKHLIRWMDYNVGKTFEFEVLFSTDKKDINKLFKCLKQCEVKLKSKLKNAEVYYTIVGSQLGDYDDYDEIEIDESSDIDDAFKLILKSIKEIGDLEMYFKIEIK